MRTNEEFHGRNVTSVAAQDFTNPAVQAAFVPVPAPEPADMPTAFEGNGLAGLLGDVDWDVLTGGDAMSAILGWKR